MLICEGDGRTDATSPVDNLTFFTELARGIIRALSQTGAFGRLYKVDMRLRPTGGSGNLVTPFIEFRRYFDSGSAQLWERQALSRARVVHGDAGFAAAVEDAVRQAALGPCWQPEHVADIVAMRERLEASRGPRDVKRGPGGQVDVEFLVQTFQLKYATQRPELREPNTWAALDALHAAGLLNEVERADLSSGYDFLRQVESRLRIMTNRALDEYPEFPAEQEKLARRLGLASASEFRATLQRHTRRVRELFRELTGRESAG